MNKSLTIILLLICFIGLGQEAKLKSAYIIRAESGDTAFWYQYVYDADDNLIYRDFGHSSASLLNRIYYRNDTIIKSGMPGGNMDWWYHYYSDSIVIPYAFDTTLVDVFHLNNSDLIIQKNSPSDIYTYEWENGNMIEEFLNGQSTYSVSYDANFINPFYEEYKYFRFSRDGSYNYIDEWGPDEAGVTNKYKVVESIGPYPIKSERYLDGELSFYHFYNYLYVISDISEGHSEETIVLSVEYFDINGRVIQKPMRGFYIERTITSKGITSTKYFKP